MVILFQKTLEIAYYKHTRDTEMFVWRNLSRYLPCNTTAKDAPEGHQLGSPIT